MCIIKNVDLHYNPSCSIFFTVMRVSKLANQILKGISPYRYLIALFFVFIPLVFYQFSRSIGQKIVPLINFDVVTVAGVLGGLVMTVAASGRVNKRVRRKFLVVAVTFVLATALLVIAAVNLTLVDLLNSIDLNTREWSVTGFTRWYSFWIAAIGYYAGTFAFAYALIDLLFALWFIIGGRSNRRKRH